MSKRIRNLFYIFSILSFMVSVFFLCIRFNETITSYILSIISKFRSDIGIEKIYKLYSFIECNIVFFAIYGFSFLLLTKLNFSPLNDNKFKFFYSFNSLIQNKFNLVLILLFIILSVIRFYWITQKQSFHMDELYGISIFHYNEYGLWSGKNFEKFTPFTGKQIRDLILFDDGSIKDTVKDLLHLWIYNRDTAYNNLFLVLSRIWYTGFQTSDFVSIFWRSSLLNYIFFAFSFYFMILLLKEITNNKVSIILTLIIAFLNTASIGISVFMRSYALQETLLILFTYLFVQYLKFISFGKDINTLSNFLKTTAILFLLINCDYFSLLYIVVLGCILITYLIIKKEYKLLYSLICSLLSALIISKIFYLNFGIGFFADRGAEALSTFSSIGQRFIIAIKESNNLINKNLISFIIILLFLIFNIISCILTKSIKSQTIKIAIFFGALLWCILVMIISPYYTLRYIAPIFPLISIGFVFNNFSKKSLNIIFSVLTLCVMILISKNAFPSKLNNSKIEHLNDTDGRIFSAEFINDPTSNVYIDRSSLYTEILPYLNDSQIYYFVDSLEELKSYNLQDDTYYYVKYEDDSPHDFTVIKFNRDKK